MFEQKRSGLENTCKKPMLHLIFCDKTCTVGLKSSLGMFDFVSFYWSHVLKVNVQRGKLILNKLGHEMFSFDTKALFYN